MDEVTTAGDRRSGNCLGVAGGCALVPFLLAVVAALAIYAGVEAYRRHQAERDRQRAELESGLRASAVIAETFARESSLRVATLSGRVLSTGDCTSGNLFGNTQRTVAPFAVAYSVDLRGIDRSSLRWNARDRVMFVDVPGVLVEPPNVDAARARSTQTGVFISRACGVAMQQQVAGRLAAAAEQRARRPDHLAEARESARVAVARLVSAPLAAAGLGNVTVRVRLATDARPRDDRQWDVSRSIDEVLHDPRLEP
jgi:hypothetical protein